MSVSSISEDDDIFQDREVRDVQVTASTTRHRSSPSKVRAAPLTHVRPVPSPGRVVNRRRRRRVILDEDEDEDGDADGDISEEEENAAMNPSTRRPLLSVAGMQKRQVRVTSRGVVRHVPESPVVDLSRSQDSGDSGGDERRAAAARAAAALPNAHVAGSKEWNVTSLVQQERQNMYARVSSKQRGSARESARPAAAAAEDLDDIDEDEVDQDKEYTRSGQHGGVEEDVEEEARVAAEDRKKLKEALLYDVSQICSGVSSSLAGDMVIRNEFVHALAEFAYGMAETMGKDLEQFAAHRQRKRINMNDVMLYARRNPSLVAALESYKAHLPGAAVGAGTVTGGDKGKKGKSAAKHTAATRRDTCVPVALSHSANRKRQKG